MEEGRGHSSVKGIKLLGGSQHPVAPRTQAKEDTLQGGKEEGKVPTPKAGEGPGPTPLGPTDWKKVSETTPLPRQRDQCLPKAGLKQNSREPTATPPYPPPGWQAPCYKHQVTSTRQQAPSNKHQVTSTRL